jgi:hypothetical protein
MMSTALLMQEASPKRPLASAVHPTPLGSAVKHVVLLNPRPLHACGAEIKGRIVRIVAHSVEPGPFSDRCHFQRGIFSVHSGPRVLFPGLFCAKRCKLKRIIRI